MTPFSKDINEVAYNPWFVTTGTAASIAGFLWFFYDKLTTTPGLFNLAILVVVASITLILYTYSLRIRAENLALHQTAKKIHEINHLYRDKLFDSLSANGTPRAEDDLLAIEADTLKSVCQRIERIFSSLIGKECLVTVKLITVEDTGKRYANTYVRSVDNCERDAEGKPAFEVGTNANPGFDHALRIRNDGNPSHYYSPDLTKEKDYYNERTNFSKYYRSAIVVPIRYRRKDKAGTPEETDDIGFLSIDTTSTNRLNSGSHVQFLAAFADQMYNFISLMRGRYCLMSTQDLAKPVANAG